MPQTKEGARKTVQYMIEKHGSYEAYREFMRTIGGRGGKTPTMSPKGFASMTPEKRAEAGRLGGKISKRKATK